MAEPKPVRRVVMVGCDEALWLTANVLTKSFGRAGLHLTAVELPSLHRAGDVIPTLRNQEAFHSLMGLKEAPLMAASQATYSLGQRFANFAKTRPPFMHPYGTTGTSMHRVKFLHHWLRARTKGLKASYEDFSLTAVAARQGLFFVPGPETEGFAECDYAYHLRAASYCEVLRQVARQRGVTHMAGRLADVRRDAETGYITAISLSDGQIIEGDFFIDATGADGLLQEAARESNFESWEHWFPCDSVLTASAPPLGILPAYSQVSAFRSGWAGLFPLRDRTSVQLAYASQDMNEQEALETATTLTSMPLGPDVFMARNYAGRRRMAWTGNCVAIGEAAATFDPISSVSIQAILLALSHLTSLFPADHNMQAERVEFNRTVASSFDRLRDFQICHYKLNQRYDQPMWDYCRDMALPDALAHKLDLFEARGHLVDYDDETFAESDWLSIFIGHGLIPRAYDPLADQMPDEEIIQRFQQMLGFIKNRVQTMKPQNDALNGALTPQGAPSVI